MLEYLYGIFLHTAIIIKNYQGIYALSRMLELCDWGGGIVISGHD